MTKEQSNNAACNGSVVTPPGNDVIMIIKLNTKQKKLIRFVKLFKTG